MIISASRRTDIPAFYTSWFFNRLREGFALVRNPFNPRAVSRVPLVPSLAECIVFWTRNPSPLVTRLDELDSHGIPYYFQFTVTPYGRDLEAGMPPRDSLLRAFLDLAARIGPRRVRWRYDPIILTGEYTADFHFTQFERLARALGGSTERCVISFLHLYRKCRRNLSGAGIVTPESTGRMMMARKLAEIAGERGIALEWCAPEDDISGTGILPGKCVDGGLIESLGGTALPRKKDPGQRKNCGCAKSADIGAYDSCAHGCLYCYATADPARAAANLASHDPLSPMLTGRPGADDIITDRADP
jgi:hypothetical protein